MLVGGFASMFLRVRLCLRINLRVVSDPLRASLASFAYTANTASWYSVRELRCCNTTEVSLLSTTAWSAGGWVDGRKKGCERWIGGTEKRDEVWKWKGEGGWEGAGGQRIAGEMENGTINGVRWKWQIEEWKKRKAGQEREIEREWKRRGNTIDLLNRIKHKCLTLKNIFHSELNGWQLWYRLDVGWASWKGLLTCCSRTSGPCKPS